MLSAFALPLIIGFVGLAAAGCLHVAVVEVVGLPAAMLVPGALARGGGSAANIKRFDVGRDVGRGVGGGVTGVGVVV